MAVKREAEIETFNTTVSEIASRGAITKEITEELSKALSEDRFKILVVEGMPTWRIRREYRNAVLFIPKGITKEQIVAQLPDILVESFAAVRNVAGPGLGEVYSLAAPIRLEISGGE